MLRKDVRRRRAFTLIELLLVMVILVVLGGIAVPIYLNRAKQAKLDAAKAEIPIIEAALDSFNVDNDRFPTNDEGLNALLEAPSNLKNWRGPYVRKPPIDPWGTPYIYRAPGQHNTTGFDLFSCGPDQQEGGGDDIVNWQQN